MQKTSADWSFSPAGVVAVVQGLHAPAVSVEFFAAIFEHIEMLRKLHNIIKAVPEFGEAHIRGLIHLPRVELSICVV